MVPLPLLAGVLPRRVAVARYRGLRLAVGQRQVGAPAGERAAGLEPGEGRRAQRSRRRLQLRKPAAVPPVGSALEAPGKEREAVEPGRFSVAPGSLHVQR